MTQIKLITGAVHDDKDLLGKVVQTGDYVVYKARIKEDDTVLRIGKVVEEQPNIFGDIIIKDLHTNNKDLVKPHDTYIVNDDKRITYEILNINKE